MIVNVPRTFTRILCTFNESVKVHGTKMENTEEYIKEPQTLPFWVS